MKPFPWRLPALITTALVLVSLGALMIVRYGGEARREQWGRPLDRITFLQEVKRLRQLVTVRYGIQRVIGIHEPKEPFGEESILLMVTGRVLAGVDLEQLHAGDVRQVGPNRLRIRLPKARVLDVALDEGETQVWDRHVTWWTPWVAPDPTLEHRARMNALEDVRQAALKLGIEAAAQRQAETAVRDLAGIFGWSVDSGD